MQFKYYVLNWDGNQRKIISYNIFRNWLLNDAVEKEIKKYLRSPKKYTNTDINDETTYGFEALCNRVSSLIMWQEWSRCEYEIAVGDIFTPEVHDILKDLNNYINDGKDIVDFKNHIESSISQVNRLEKWDCYKQTLPNIEMIARELIYQYKQFKKEKGHEN